MHLESHKWSSWVTFIISKGYNLKTRQKSFFLIFRNFLHCPKCEFWFSTHQNPVACKLTQLHEEEGLIIGWFCFLFLDQLTCFCYFHNNNTVQTKSQCHPMLIHLRRWDSLKMERKSMFTWKILYYRSLL